MDIKLYDRNLTTPAPPDDLTDKVQNLKFSTKLHGGFYLCTFNLKADLPEAWEWFTGKAFCRLVISDATRTLWEGRIEDIGLSEGAVTVTAYGYYANLSDIPYNTAYNDNFDVVLKAVLTACCTQISADQSNIDATGGPAITSGADSEYLDIYPKEIVEKLAKFSDDTYSGKWFFAVWEDRVPYLKRRVTTAIDWQTAPCDFARFKLVHRGAELWNSCYAVYDAGGVVTRTATTNDTDSQTKYGSSAASFTRRKVIPQLGSVAAATAQAARDHWLEEYHEIWGRMEDMVLGPNVQDANGVPYPSSRVRAGDVLRVRDLVPASADLDAIARDALRTFYIVETSYDAERGELRITPDLESASLDAILAKKVK